MPRKPTLILLYGPPAVGKLTVAKALAKQAKFAIFHNHITRDAVSSILPKVPDFNKIVDGVRLLLFKAAVENKVDIIFTFVYAHKEDDKIFSNFTKTWRTGGGRVLPVLLTTNDAVLRQRVTAPSRRSHRKIQDVHTLKKTLEKYELKKVHPKEDSLVIDTTKQSALKTAKVILASLRKAK